MPQGVVAVPRCASAVSSNGGRSVFHFHRLVRGGGGLVSSNEVFSGLVGMSSARQVLQRNRRCRRGGVGAVCVVVGLKQSGCLRRGTGTFQSKRRALKPSRGCHRCPSRIPRHMQTTTATRDNLLPRAQEAQAETMVTKITLHIVIVMLCGNPLASSFRALRLQKSSPVS